jgi:hypothetical protein
MKIFEMDTDGTCARNDLSTRQRTDLVTSDIIQALGQRTVCS